MHCWHQAVRVKKALPEDQYGDIHVDTAKSREVYRRWLDMTRPADKFFLMAPPPYPMLRPLKRAGRSYICLQKSEALFSQALSWK